MFPKDTFSNGLNLLLLFYWSILIKDLYSDLPVDIKSLRDIILLEGKLEEGDLMTQLITAMGLLPWDIDCKSTIFRVRYNFANFVILTKFMKLTLMRTHRKSHTKELWGLLGPQDLVLYPCNNRKTIRAIPKILASTCRAFWKNLKNLKIFWPLWGPKRPQKFLLRLNNVNYNVEHDFYSCEIEWLKAKGTQVTVWSRNCLTFRFAKFSFLQYTCLLPLTWLLSRVYGPLTLIQSVNFECAR